MKRNPADNEKPVLDAVNDAVSALSDLVRSVRGARPAGKKPRPDLKTKAKAAVAEVQEGAGDAADDVRHAGHTLREHFEKAWSALTGSKSGRAAGSKAAESKNGSKGKRVPRKPARRSGAKRTARAKP